VEAPFASGADEVLALARRIASSAVEPIESQHERRRLASERSLAESHIERNGLTASTRAPEFRLPDLQGHTVSLDDYRGPACCLYSATRTVDLATNSPLIWSACIGSIEAMDLPSFWWGVAAKRRIVVRQSDLGFSSQWYCRTSGSSRRSTEFSPPRGVSDCGERGHCRGRRSRKRRNIGPCR